MSPNRSETGASLRRVRPANSGPDRPTPAPSDERLLRLILVLLIAILGVLVLFMLLHSTGSKPQVPTGTGPWPVLEITGPARGDAPDFDRPLSAAWGPNDQIYVSDTGNRRICVFSDTGAFIREFGRSRASADAPYSYAMEQPAGIVVADDGTVYVADVRAGRVVVFDRKGAFVRAIRPKVTQRSGPWAPTDIALASTKLYVSDANGIAVFSAAGTLIGRIDSAAGSAFSHPNGVRARTDGSLLVSDTDNARVIALRPDGSVLWVCGPSSGNERVIGLPRGISVAANGDVLVADAFLFGVVRISPSGTYIERYGTQGSAPGQFAFPNDVAIRGELVVVADKENNRVQLVRYPGLLGHSTAGR